MHLRDGQNGACTCDEETVSCINATLRSFWCCPRTTPNTLLQESIGHVSQDVEKKGLKASERSDHNVHKAYDKSADALSNLKGDAQSRTHEAKDKGTKAGQNTADKAKKICTIM